MHNKQTKKNSLIEGVAAKKKEKKATLKILSNCLNLYQNNITINHRQIICNDWNVTDIKAYN